MDPDAALTRILELARIRADRADELGELVLGLHDWLTRGGFLPEPWQRNWPAERRIKALEVGLRGVLQDVSEVLERQGEEWWDETVTSGLHHRQEAAKLLGETPP